MPSLSDFQVFAFYVLTGCGVVAALTFLVCVFFPIDIKEPPRG
jgi:uncharacterized membrane protein